MAIRDPFLFGGGLHPSGPHIKGTSQCFPREKGSGLPSLYIPADIDIVCLPTYPTYLNIYTYMYTCSL